MLSILEHEVCFVIYLEVDTSVHLKVEINWRDFHLMVEVRINSRGDDIHVDCGIS